MFKSLYGSFPFKYALVMILAGCPGVFAQDVGTTHVIPIVAAGAVGDGTFYASAFLITRMDNEGTVSCTLEAGGGFPSSRLFETSFNLTGVTGYQNFTTPGGNLATGYATLSCNAPVTVSTLYVLSDIRGPISFATVFSQGTFRRASLHAFTASPRTRAGIAITNNSPVTANYRIEVDIAGTVFGKNLTLAPQSTSSRFLDEILDLPLGPSGLVISITSDQEIAATGLLFIDNKFTTIPLSIFN